MLSDQKILKGKVEIFLEQREIAFLSPSKIFENLNFSTEIQILLGDKNAIYLCSKIISTSVIRRAIAARLLFRQNMGGHFPPAPSQHPLLTPLSKVVVHKSVLSTS